jgi:hypothetical protein
MAVPKIVFIVPYRNRSQHKFFFSNYLTTIMKDTNIHYEIYFSHQCDIRAFNRGATKNIGFLAVKEKYPNDYKNITFVFNDIDTIPFASIFNYETEKGTIKHFYGFNYALGGIVAFNGEDFEKTNGFPNYWGWGMEDNVLQKRSEKNGLKIDRSQFYPIGNPNILHLFDGVQRIINRKDPWRATNDDGIDGLKTIHKLQYTLDTESLNPLDNVHVVNSENIFVINISTFMTGVKFEHDNYHKYDLREPARKIIHPDKIRTNKIDHITDDWSKIPFYPNSQKRKEMVSQYGEKLANEIIEYSYENSTDPTTELMPPTLPQTPQTRQTNNQPNNTLTIQQKIQQFNEAMRRSNLNQRIVPPNINKYSPEYAKLIAAKPRASASANIKLGGVY